MATTRRLAAIMFADIVGYTSMMQRDEQAALAKLHVFKENLESQVSIHQGEIVQYYGDGCLVIFESSVNALTCAKVVQGHFIQEKVPVRIGLHVGDIVKKEGNIFGDAVNIASRVESMGIPGSILLSSSVRNQVKNQTEFELVDLGRFTFKNVEEEMSVYALANAGFVVPKLEELQGKGKSIQEGSQNALAQASMLQQWIRFGSIGVLAMIIGGLLTWNIAFKGNGQEKLLSEETRQARIAVLPFENRTNDPDLDVLGDIAADWINRGFMELEDVEVVSPATARMHKDAIGVRPNDPEGRATFAQLTGAENLVRGSFYESNGEVVFSLELHDARDGRLKETFDEVRGNKENKEALLGSLSESIMGYWVARDLVAAHQIQTPKYEAYSRFLNSLKDAQYAPTELQAVLALDSNFHLARIHYLNFNRGNVLGGNAAHFAFFERNLAALSKYEAGWYAFLKSYYEGDPRSTFIHIDRLRKKYPYDLIINHETATIALEGLHNPSLALSIYEEIPLKDLDPQKMGSYFVFRVINTLYSLAQLDREEELEQTLREVRANFSSSWIPIDPIVDLIAYIFLEQEEQFQDAYLAFQQLAKKNLITYATYNFGFYNSNYFTPEERVELFRIAGRTTKTLNDRDPVYQAFYNLWPYLEGDEDKFLLPPPKELPYAFQLYNYLYPLLFYLHDQQQEKVGPLLKKLEALPQHGIELSAQWGSSLKHYYLAIGYASLGETELALKNLAKAKQAGIAKYFSFYEYDFYLQGLKDDPRFQEIIEPVWPEGYGPS